MLETHNAAANCSHHLAIEDIDAQHQFALLNLTLAEGQQQFIEPISDCLQEAQSDSRYVPKVLCRGQDVVGFAMYGLFVEAQGPRVWFDRFMLGQAFQGQGLGNAFALLMIEYLFEQFQCTEIYLSVYPNNAGAIALYLKLGFVFNGEIDRNGEHVMLLVRNR